MNGFNLSDITDARLGATTLGSIYLGYTKLWPLAIDYSREYLTIKSLADNNTIKFIKLAITSKAETKTIYWSSDKATWNSVSSSESGTTIKTLSNNEKIYIKGSNNYYGSDEWGYNYFSSDYEFNISGNIMSLIYGDNFIGQTTLPSASYIFSFIFERSKVVDASNLILPATILADSCYSGMFGYCNSLTTAPELPATTLADSCYYQMFSNCTSLATAPELPATTLASYCYQSMFGGCSSLTTAPALPATTLAISCYNEMFYGCTSLTTAPELPATTLANYCYSQMFYDCTSLNYIKMLATDISATNCLEYWVDSVASTGTFVKDYNLKSIPINSASGIPTGWTIKEVNIDYSQEPFTIEALEDNVTISINNQKACQLTYTKNGVASQTLTVSANVTEALNVTLDTGDICTFTSARWIQDRAKGHFIVSGQFKVYGNFMSLKNYSTSIDTQGCEGALKDNVGLIDASNLVMPATSLGQNAYNSFFNGCTSLVSAPKELPVNGDNTHALMFANCTSLINPPKLLFTNIGNGGCNQMFRGCTSLVKAPDLNITNVGTWGCYQMFYGCSSLNYLKCMATTKDGNSNFSSWLYGVASSGTFVKDANSTLWGSGSSGIPSGWTVTNV